MVSQAKEPRFIVRKTASCGPVQAQYVFLSGDPSPIKFDGADDRRFLVPTLVGDALLIRKPAAVGPTGLLWLFSAEGAISVVQQKLDRRYLPLIARCLWPDCDLAVLVLQLAAIQLSEEQAVQLDHALDGGITVQRLADIVDLPALVTTANAWQEQQSRNGDLVGRDVHQLTLRRSPDRVEFRLDEHLRPLPYGPANHRIAAFVFDLLRDGDEAITHRRIRQRTACDVSRVSRAGLHALTEAADVRLDEFGRPHVGVSKAEDAQYRVAGSAK